MHLPRSVVAAVTPLCLLAATGARGAELQQPVPLYTAGLTAAASPGATNPRAMAELG